MRSIRGRLLALLLTGVTLALAAGGATVYWMARASVLRQLDAGLASRALALTSLVSYADGVLEFEFDTEPTEATRDGYFEFRTHSGEVIRRSANLVRTSLAMPAFPERGALFADVDLPGRTPGRAAWLAFRPRHDDEDSDARTAPRRDPGVMIVAAAVDRSPTDRALATLLLVLLAVGAVVEITVSLLVIWGVRWGLVPLDALSRQLGNVSGGTLSQRLEPAGAPRELLPVYRELNQMLDRVEATLERERSFANAAAHELRTPLAELRSTAEVALRWPDNDRALAALTEALSIGHEMERLVECLLLIGRGKADTVAGASDDVPVASLVRRCLERATPSIDDKGLHLTVELDEHETLRAPRDAVEIILRNLIDNAVQYTPSRGSIAIRGNGVLRGSPWLVVENGPVELAQEDLAHLFEPFWRAEGSRSDRRHAGLGLAVVHQIARAIGLSIDAGLTGDRLQIRLSVAGGLP